MKNTYEEKNGKVYKIRTEVLETIDHRQEIAILQQEIAEREEKLATLHEFEEKVKEKEDAEEELKDKEK